MSSRSNRASPRLCALIALCGACFAPSLLAQPPHQSPPPADALRGPEVRDRQVPGVEGSFGEAGGERKRFINENRLPPRVFRDAMETVLAPDAPESLRVTDDQRARYRTWMDDFQKSVGAYMKEHATELRDLRQKSGEPGRPGANRPGGPDAQNKPPQPDEMKPDADPKETGAARERLQSLMAGAPKIEDLYTKIWTELKPEQQKAVDEKLQEFRDRQAKEREDRYVQQKTGKKKGEAGQPPKSGDKSVPRPTDPALERAPEAGGPQGPIDPQRRDRLMRLFAKLTPEQQDQLLQRLERFRTEGGENQPRPLRRRPGGADAPGEPKPAPQPDDSMMPPPPKPPEGQP
jgi:hypothetical protein